MQLKVAAARRETTRFARLRKWARYSLFVAVIGVFCGGVFLAGVVTERKGLAGKAKKVLGLDVRRVASNYLQSVTANPEHITIDIKHKHLQQIAAWRKQALRQKQITSDLKQYVPATIRYKDKRLRVGLRLKGEWTDHLETDKWSFRVKIKSDDNLFGMKRFSLQHPLTRSYVYEWVYQRALEREDVVALRYQFVTVTLNGRDMGVYALEESFAKQLIEHNQRRQGVIVRFNADHRYRPLEHKPGLLDTEAETGIDSQHSSEIIAYDQDKLAEDPALRNQFLVAHNLFEGLREGRLATHEVFHSQRLAMYFAIADLMGTRWTADDWSDMRFLYNPITSRLEPIGVEGAYYFPIRRVLGAKYAGGGETPDQLHGRIFSDPVFFRHYVSALQKVSQADYVDRLFAALDPQLHEQAKIIYREWPYKYVSRKLLRDNAEVIRDFLRPSKGLHAYLLPGEDGVCKLELGAIQALPIEVLRVTSGDVTFSPANDEEVILPGKADVERVSYRTVRFEAKGKAAWTDQLRDGLQIHYRVLGTQRPRVTQVFDLPRLDEALLASDVIRRLPNHEEFSFLWVNDADKAIVVAPGEWTIDHNLILPAGHTIVAGEGVRLNLTGGAMILSYSPLFFTGSEEDPVVVHSSDGSGQGLVVMEASRKSLLRYTVFRNLKTPRQGRWELTGAITFYRSPVDFHRCEFVDNDSEDGLNIVRCEFLINRSTFRNTTSDALDGDFCTGKITASSFYRIGGDAIDLSGSKVELENIYATDIGDKAVSAGEATYLTGRKIEINRARIGIASKDLSRVVLEKVDISAAEMGLAVFQKKAEYGPAQMKLNGLKLKRAEADFVVEKKSSLSVNDRTIDAGYDNVKALIYGPEDGVLIGTKSGDTPTTRR